MFCGAVIILLFLKRFLVLLLLFLAFREALPKFWDGLQVLDSDGVLFLECLKDVIIDPFASWQFKVCKEREGNGGTSGK